MSTLVLRHEFFSLSLQVQRNETIAQQMTVISTFSKNISFLAESRAKRCAWSYKNTLCYLVLSNQKSDYFCRLMLKLSDLSACLAISSEE